MQSIPSQSFKGALLTVAQHKDIMQLIRKVGDYAAQMQPQVMADASMRATKADKSIVTQVDLTVSRELIYGLSKITPGIDVLSEESKNQLTQIQAAAKEGKPIWVVDPLDGTASYTGGFQEYAVNVGLLVPDAQGQMQPALGFVYFPGQKLFLYTDTQGKAVVLDTETNTTRKCTPKLHGSAAESYAIAIGWRKGDDRTKSPLSGINADDQKYTGPFRAAKVMLGDCNASVMNGGASVWDTAGIHAVANAAGLAFLPFDDDAKQFQSHGMYYGGEAQRYYKGHDLVNPPFICASPAFIKSLGLDVPLHAQGNGVGR